MTIQIPQVPLLSFEVSVNGPVDKDLVFKLEAEPQVFNELVRFAQAGLDLKDPLQHEVWTTRFAQVLAEKFEMPVPPTPAQATLIAMHATQVWKETVANFQKGLQ